MVLAKLFFSNNDICEHLSNECSNFFKKSAVDSDADEVAEYVFCSRSGVGQITVRELR